MPVPDSAAPFDNFEVLQMFNEVLRQVELEDIMPAGYGITPDELALTGYPHEEVIKGGRQGRKEMRITLSVDLWLPRAIRWCQALEVMSTLLIEQQL